MIRRAMDRPVEPLQRALATLQTRWGSAAIRLGDGRPADAATAARGTAHPVHGALALSVLPKPDEADPVGTAGPQAGQVGGAAAPAGVISTGFPALDAILGPSGLPSEASVVVRGGPCSGKTTLALRCVAEAQAGGDIVAWLDLARALDPVEALDRGVDLRWLLVIRPADATEGFALAGSLLSGRCVGLLVVDLPARSQGRLEEPLRRLAAHARRVGARLIVLEPISIDGAVQAALARGTGLRLELERRAWLRLGRDVVGQRTTVAVVKNRYGPPGRSVDLDIHYLSDGERSVATHRLASESAEEPARGPLRLVPVDHGPRPVGHGPSPVAHEPRPVVHKPGSVSLEPDTEHPGPVPLEPRHPPSGSRLVVA